MKTQASKLEINAAALKRWQTRLKRALTMLDKLDRQKKRLEKAKLERPRGSVDLANFSETFGPAIRESFEDARTKKKQPEPDLAIPSYLRRTPDPAVEQLKREQEETKKAKAKGRIEKMKAKQRGDLAKMPLSGKAALDAIRNG
jgi:hypothetical protein